MPVSPLTAKYAPICTSLVTCLLSGDYVAFRAVQAEINTFDQTELQELAGASAGLLSVIVEQLARDNGISPIVLWQDISRVVITSLD